MTPNRFAIASSLTLHGLVIGLVFALSTSMAFQEKPIPIDFTLLEPVGPPTPPKDTPPKKTDAPVIAKRRPSPAPAKQKTIPLQPATEPEAPVPILAAPKPTRPSSHGLGSADGVEGEGGNPFGTEGGSGGGRQPTADELKKRYLADHFAYIKKIIEQNMTYPDRARRHGWTGKCIVVFSVQQNGHTRNIRVLDSSGHNILDDNVVDTIKRVEPFPKPPIPVTLTMPFIYDIK